MLRDVDNRLVFIYHKKADLAGAFQDGANLAGILFQGVDLTGAMDEGWRLRGAVLGEADLGEANLSCSAQKIA